MKENLIKVTPDLEKSKSILKMAETTLEMIQSLNLDKFASNITKEYYEVIRELLGIILLLDGYRIFGEGSHKRLIEYVEENYLEFNQEEINLIDNLRIIRNKISYDGFFVEKDYIKRKLKDIKSTIKKLKFIINKKLNNVKI